MSQADVNTEMAAAVTALKSGDYPTAMTRAICAQGLIAASPSVRHGDEEITWPPDRIDLFIQNIVRAQAANTASGGLQRTRVDYVRPST